MGKKVTNILLKVFLIIFIWSLIYIITGQIRNEAEEKLIEELQLQKNPENVDIVQNQIDSNFEGNFEIIIENNSTIESQMSNQSTLSPYEPEDTSEILNCDECLVESSEEELKILPEYQPLYAQNQDLVGWIKIEDTPINYPVMQTFDNPTFYINRDWYKNESYYGLPLVDARCTLNSENILIYSHNKKDYLMFGSLTKYTEKSFYDDHQIIQFDTIYEKAQYQIIAVFLSKVFYDVEPDEGEFVFYDYIELDTKEQFQEYINQIKAHSLYDTGITAEYGDNLISLCTCNYHVTDGRILVVAKKIQ